MIRETWASWNTKAIWEWDGHMWGKIGYRRVGERRWGRRFDG